MPRSVRCAAIAGAAAIALIGGPRAADAATEKLATSCSANLSDSTAPVFAPLTEVLGEDVVEQLAAFFTESFVGEALVGSEGSTCLANMNGTVLGAALTEGFASGTCAEALSLTSIPFVQHALGNLTAVGSGSWAGPSSLSGSGSATVGDSISDSASADDDEDYDGLSAFVRHLGDIPADEVEQFCTLYVDAAVPCLRSQVLPSLTTLRAKYSSGCCDAWDDSTVDDFGYTVSGKFVKLAQLFGDVMCATQTPAFSGSDSQRCGYALLQSTIDSTSAELLATSLVKDVQVPTDQMCLWAEGESYNNTQGVIVAGSTPTLSGCVVTLDRAATWFAKLPLASASDIAALFTDDDCVAGTDFLALVSDYLPSGLQDAATALFASACVHIPTTYADGCSFARPASLIDWDYEPLRASQGGSASEEAAASDINSIATVPPDVTGSNAASVSTLSTVFMLIAAVNMLHAAA